MKVIKRDGTTVDFDRSKIIVALNKANDAVDECDKIGKEQIEAIADYVADTHKKRMLVEDIQDTVEEKLMELGCYNLMKAYIIYRYNRADLLLGKKS